MGQHRELAVLIDGVDHDPPSLWFRPTVITQTLEGTDLLQSVRLGVEQAWCATTGSDLANAIGAVTKALPTRVMARALAAKAAFWMAFMITSPLLRPQNTASRLKLQLPGINRQETPSRR
jgi:hypothetical protein